MNTKGTCMDEKITGVNVKGTFVGERAHVGMKRQICEQKGYTWVRKGRHMWETKGHICCEDSRNKTKENRRTKILRISAQMSTWFPDAVEDNRDSHLRPPGSPTLCGGQSGLTPAEDFLDGTLQNAD